MTPTACGLLCLSGQSCLLPLPWDLGPACPAVLAAKCCCPQYGGSQASCFRGAGPWALEWPHCMARKGASDNRAKVAALTVRACLVGHSTPTLHVTHGLPSTAHLVWPPALAAPTQAGYTLKPPQPHPRPSLTCPHPQPTMGLRAGDPAGTPLLLDKGLCPYSGCKVNAREGGLAGEAATALSTLGRRAARVTHSHQRPLAVSGGPAPPPPAPYPSPSGQGHPAWPVPASLAHHTGPRTAGTPPRPVGPAAPGMLQSRPGRAAR